jgi:predicted AlkP superfamily phosphohydrolase/phosphomutase
MTTMTRTTVRRPVPFALAIGVAMAAVGCARGTPASEPTPPEQRRAIVFSIDALNEENLRGTLDPEAVPNLLAMFDAGACAEYTVAAFPSLTAPGHAALWTGAFGDVTGVKANWQPGLPRDRFALSQTVSGFSAEVLRAEPLWITLARQGRTVVGHHVTQGPQLPGYPALQGEQDGALRARQAAAASALQRPEVAVLNGYNRMIAPHRILNADSIAPRPAAGWRNLDRLGTMRVAPREIALLAGTDSVFALFFGESRIDRVLFARERDAARGVVAVARAAEDAPLGGRPLARRFSEALEMPVEGGRVFLRARLWEVAPDASTYALFLPPLQVAEANRPDVQASYDDAVRGWIGNAPTFAFRDGAFGPSLLQGGDGTAEARYFETVELVTRQFMRGVEWAWTTRRPQVMLDYFPLGDEVDHAFFGRQDRRWPEHTPEGDAWARRIRGHVWALVDMRFAQLRALAASDHGTVLFVTGDHGMRATWQVFRPNAALREAGLLAVDAEGRIDPTRSRALSPNGYWISVNRTAWQGGIVPPAEEAEVIAAAERAIRAVRGPGGEPVVTTVYRPSTHPDLGLGGPVGGDLYYGTAPGVRWTGAPTGSPLSPGSISAGHGFPSTDRDMRTAFCATGERVAARRFGAVRSVDVAPTVSEWIGVESPRDAVGRSAWPQVRGTRQ